MGRIRAEFGRFADVRRGRLGCVRAGGLAGPKVDQPDLRPNMGGQAPKVDEAPVVRVALGREVDCRAPDPTVGGRFEPGAISGLFGAEPISPRSIEGRNLAILSVTRSNSDPPGVPEASCTPCS